MQLVVISESELIKMPDTWNNISVDIWAALIGLIGIIVTAIGIIRFAHKNKQIKDEENSRLSLPPQQRVYIVKNTGNKFIIFIGIIFIALSVAYFAFQIYDSHGNSGWAEDGRFSRFFEKKDDTNNNDAGIKAYTRSTITPFLDIGCKKKGTTEVFFSATECFITGIYMKDKEKIARFTIGSDTEILYYYDLNAFIDNQCDFETFSERGYGSNDLIIAMANKEVRTYDKRINHINKQGEYDANEIGYFINDPCFIVSILENQESKQGEKKIYAQVIYKSDEENDSGYRLAWIYYNDLW